MSNAEEVEVAGPFFHHAVDDGCRIAHAVGGLGDALAHGGVDGLQQRQYVEPDFVSHHVVHEVRAVGDVVLPDAAEIVFYLHPTDAKQRSVEDFVDWCDAAQAMNACAADEIDE